MSPEEVAISGSGAETPILDALLAHRQGPASLRWRHHIWHCEVTWGVPQGCVLGPLMFIIFNDIGNGIAENTTICLIADDALLYHQNESHRDHIKLQDDLKRLMDWAATWHMEFNPTKCYIMHFMTKYQKRTTCAAPYTMAAHSLERVSDSKYFGVTLKEHLEWFTHT